MVCLIVVTSLLALRVTVSDRQRLTPLRGLLDLDKLVKQARELIEEGVFNQHTLFEILNKTNRKHYSTIRNAIHIAKCGG